jgi:hypothetical protein
LALPRVRWVQPLVQPAPLWVRQARSLVQPWVRRVQRLAESQQVARRMLRSV